MRSAPLKTLQVLINTTEIMRPTGLGHALVRRRASLRLTTVFHYFFVLKKCSHRLPGNAFQLLSQPQGMRPTGLGHALVRRRASLRLTTVFHYFFVLKKCALRRSKPFKSL
ncbi:MAG: hypothetical protein AB1546_04795 [bacterium]